MAREHRGHYKWGRSATDLDIHSHVFLSYHQNRALLRRRAMSSLNLSVSTSTNKRAIKACGSGQSAKARCLDRGGGMSCTRCFQRSVECSFEKATSPEPAPSQTTIQPSRPSDAHIDHCERADPEQSPPIAAEPSLDNETMTDSGWSKPSVPFLGYRPPQSMLTAEDSYPEELF